MQGFFCSANSTGEIQSIFLYTVLFNVFIGNEKQTKLFCSREKEKQNKIKTCLPNFRWVQRLPNLTHQNFTPTFKLSATVLTKATTMTYRPFLCSKKNSSQWPYFGTLNFVIPLRSIVWYAYVVCVCVCARSSFTFRLTALCMHYWNASAWIFKKCLS